MVKKHEAQCCALLELMDAGLRPLLLPGSAVARTDYRRPEQKLAHHAQNTRR
jgi:hypothetical protein